MNEKPNEEKSPFDFDPSKLVVPLAVAIGAVIILVLILANTAGRF